MKQARPSVSIDIVGPAYPELGWVPAPRYLLRRARVLSHVQPLGPGKLVEVGPGAGALLGELAGMGWQAQALEASRDAREIASTVLASSGVEVRAEAGPDWRQAMDLVIALDVLEHIENDSAAVGQWTGWLKPGGRLVLSVPAHPRMWSRADEWAGHFRRYTRDGLEALIAGQGLEIVTFECYGFPLTNITERLQAWFLHPKARGAGESEARARQRNNDRSGIERRAHMRVHRLVAGPLGRMVLRAALWTQSRFLSRNLGSGYLVVARRPAP